MIFLIELIIDLIMIGIIQFAGFVSRTFAFKKSKPKLSDFKRNFVAALFLFILIVSVYSIFFKS